MFNKLILLILILLSSDLCAQINRHIVYDSNKVAGKYGKNRIFIGTFDLEEFPQPLKPTKVNYSLEIVGFKPIWPANADWTMKLYYYDNVVRISGDTLFTWPAPHEVGDKFIGSFEFTPLMSGYQTILIDFAGTTSGYLFANECYQGLAFRWCLDEYGNLQYLDQYAGSTPTMCGLLNTIYFHDDSVNFRQIPGHRKESAFEYEINIVPTPRIGDTSRVSYKLRANEDFPYGCNLRIFAYSMEVLSNPSKLNYDIKTGDTIEYCLDIIPKAVRKGHAIILDLGYIYDEDNSISQKVGCHFIFNNDGSLRYAGDFSLGLNYDSLYPYNYPHPDAKTDNTVIDLIVDDDYNSKVNNIINKSRYK